MCGRYSLTVSPDEIAQHFGLSDVPPMEPRYNVAPTQDMPVVVSDGDPPARRLSVMRWGLVPFSANSPDGGARLINARSESVMVKPSFRWAFRKSRCLVPADGFYEWKTTAMGKRPYHIRFRDRRVFALAGLWDEWSSPEGNRLETFTILTTEPNDIVRPLHDRMPVILSPGSYERWLAPTESADGLRALFAPITGVEMSAIPVSPLVNRPENDGPRCLDPAPEPLELDLFS